MKHLVVEPSFAAWQRAARDALHAELAPGEVTWSSAGSEPSLNLFSESADARAQKHDEQDPHAEKVTPTFRVPAAFVQTAQVVLVHSDESKWATLYRVLWRLTHGEGKLLQIPTDADVIALSNYEKEVRKDAYRMRQYLRFREIKLEDGSWFAAWFEPQHDSVQLNQDFFVDRFANLRWSILTPKRCLHWDGTKVRLSAGVDKSMAPADDAVESLWITYYSSVFNPARVKVRAMKAQMPVRNWKNLPEARAIGSLLANAPLRVNSMMERSNADRVRDRDHPVAQPPPTADWRVLREAAGVCRACPLWKNATCTVFGEGPLDARVVLVGEQPGNDEDLAGRPFVGPAGQLLNRALEQAGIERSQLYLTNAVKHFKWEPRGKRRIHQKPGRMEIVACHPWLEAELRLLRPQRIVALGATAARTLFDADLRITEHRGQFLPSRHGATLVTVHPSSLLRLPPGVPFEPEFQKFVAELKQLKV